MLPSTNRPRVFISSTIVDFRDLRSALKFWLEELGLEARMSEFNDFVRRPEQDTFESCLAGIADCHYYVLLVGGRKGSEYKPGVSVTQQEFRTAAEIARQGHIRLIVLAREEVLTVLRERRRLSGAIDLETLETASSPYLQDPQFIAEFLEEIEQTQLKEKGEDPSGKMWIYGFSNFRDLADALRTNLRLYGSVPRKTLLANLQWELIENITVMCSKRDDLPEPGYVWLDRVRKQVHLSSNAGDQAISLTAEQANQIIWFLMTGTPSPSRLRSSALHDAISSREFLYYDQVEARLQPSPELLLMYDLLKEIETYQTSYAWWWEKNLERVVSQLREGIRFQFPRVLEVDLLFIFAFRDRLVNIMRLSISLLDYILEPLQGVRPPILLDASPYGGEESERVQAEQPTHQEVQEWLSFDWIRRDLTRDYSQQIGLEQMKQTFDQYPAYWDSFERLSGISKQDMENHLELQKTIQKIFNNEGFDAAYAYLQNEFLQGNQLKEEI